MTSGVDRWLTNGWAVVADLLSADQVEAALKEVFRLVPTPDEYFGDPAAARRAWDKREPFASLAGVLAEGPEFRPEQFRWTSSFPFVGCPQLTSICLHPQIVALAQECLGTHDIRLYQAGLEVRYAGDADYEQPLHVDSNHSYLPPSARRRWRHLEGFVYLSDVSETTGATRIVDLDESVQALAAAEPEPWPDAEAAKVRESFVPGRVIKRSSNPEIYTQERPAVGRAGSFLAYGPQVLHRGAALADPRACRVLLNISFRSAEQDWVGYHSWQPQANDRAWIDLMAGRTPEQLAVFGFPRPGHPVWDDDLIARTGARYPGLDMQPWSVALGSSR